MVKKTYTASCGPKKTNDLGVVASAKQFYRKYVMKRGRYNLEIDDAVE